MATSITVNGNTYNDGPYDAATNPNGLANGGWRIDSKFIAMLLDTLADATATLRTTSTTSLTIGTGSVGPITLAQDLPFDVGDFVLVTDTAAPTTNWMVGQITVRTSNDITVNVTKTAGGGTLASWTVQISAPPGETGATGPAGTDGTNNFIWQGVIASNRTFADDDFAVMDCTAAARDATFPASPAPGDKVKIGKIGNGGVVNVLRNGANINGAAADETLPAEEIGTWEFTYVDASTGWLWEY